MIDGIAQFCDAGFAVHWLQAKSKKPVGTDGKGSGWSAAPVASFDDLQRTYRPGYNVGIRTGEPSLTSAGYLYLIDMDIRVPDLADEAWEAFGRLFPGVDRATLPTVASGSGGESRHLYFFSDKAFSGKKLALSEGKHRREVVDPATGEVKDVWSHDWEIDLFGTDRQAVMPPSIHPDTGKPYTWEREFDFDLLDLGMGPSIPSAVIEALGVAESTAYAFEAKPPLTFRPGQLEDELDLIPVSRIDDREDWITLGQALHHQFGGGDEGFELWMKHSARGSKFLVGSSRKKELRRYRAFGRSRRQPVTLASVRDWVKEVRAASFLDEFDDLDDDAGAVEDTAEVDPTDDILGGTVSNDPLSDDYVSKADLKEEAEAKANGTSIAWKSLLDYTDGTPPVLKGTLHNVELIVRNDPRLVGLPQLNEFTMETVQRIEPGKKGNRRKNSPKDSRQLAGRVWQVRDNLNGEIWSSARDYAVRSILEAPKSQGGYSLKIPDRDLKAAIVLSAWDSSFHPVREYLTGLKWDGVKRMDKLFIDYLGAKDNAYNRDVARLLMIGAVTRVFEPGHKFDFAVILEGLQGRGKSTFIRTLGKRWFAELEGDFHDGKEMVEKMQGAWIMEIPELSGFGRADVRSIKAFISRQVDKVRLAYEARAQDFPRQCVLIGSTNDKEYLKDDTGGRRFLPMECRVDMIDIAGLRANVDQLWAESYAAYLAMRVEQPTEELALFLSGAEAAAEAARLQESRRVESADDGLAGRIAAWLDRPVNDGGFDDSGDGRLRNHTCLVEIWCEVMQGDTRSYGQIAAQQLGRAMRLVPGWSTEGKFFTFQSPYGRQRVYERIGSNGRHDALSS